MGNSLNKLRSVGYLNRFIKPKIFGQDFCWGESEVRSVPSRPAGMGVLFRDQIDPSAIADGTDSFGGRACYATATGSFVICFEKSHFTTGAVSAAGSALPALPGFFLRFG